MIVVDTQILVHAATENPLAHLAAGVRGKDAEWHTSPLWRTEFRSMLAGALRRGALGMEAGLRAFALAERHLKSEVPVDTAALLALVSRSRCSAYDLEFVAVAQALGVRLVTNDKQILADFPTIAISPEAFAA